MCGIFLYIKNEAIRGKDKKRLIKLFNKISHRGPDHSVIKYYNDNVMVGFHRLAIVDPSVRSTQPFESDDGRYVCVVNGEIYNYMDIKNKLDGVEWKTHSDCEVVLHLFQYYHGDTKQVCAELDGEYSFVIYDLIEQKAYMGTDEVSVRPLFVGYTESHIRYGRKYKEVFITSEQKAIESFNVIRMKGGHYGSISLDGYDINKYYDLNSINVDHDITKEMATETIYQLLVDSVKKKINPDREFGFLLSGGLDSSLVCSIAAKILHPVRIKTFTVGFSADATDVLAAKKVADHINSIHETFIFTYQDGIDVVDDVIYYGETYDQTSIRASTPMMLGLRSIKKKYPEMAVIFSGELADELFRGYLYNLLTPNLEEGRRDQIQRLEDIHMFDGLRADRMCSSVSMELRLPFFDKFLINYVMSLPMEYLDPSHNDNIEKYILRKAFDKNYLPNEILFRTKNAFSDASSVKSGWKDVLKNHCEKMVTDSRFSFRNNLYGFNTPQTKEDFYYRELFEECGYEEKTIKYKWLSSWCGDITDSSASTISVFHEDDI